MEDIKLIHLDETDSTNRFLHDYHDEEGRTMTVVFADYQSDGHGQDSNHWESERDKNLTLSLKTHPQNVPANRQFVMLEAMALAIRSVLCLYTDSVTIKWPNDIYWQEQKIGGILIENELSGRNLDACIIGVGLNLNQHEFMSDAPNPVSLWQITGTDHDATTLLEHIITRFYKYYQQIKAGTTEEVESRYHDALLRIDYFEDADLIAQQAAKYNG